MVTWARHSSDWAGQPYTYDRRSQTVFWVPSGAVTPATWAAAIVQSPATATVRSGTLRTALPSTPNETKDTRSPV